VLRNQRLQAAPGPVIRALQGVDPTLLLRWRQAWESANHRWNQWVLGYSSAQQYDLLSQLGVESPTREDLARVLGLAACTLALLAALVLKWPRRAALSPAQILAARWRRQLQRRGLSWPQAMPPLTFAAELEATGQTEPHPQRQLAWQEAASCLRDFHQLCYAPPEATAAPPWRTLAHRFQRALRQLPLSRP
jgi:transposase-like protein